MKRIIYALGISLLAASPLCAQQNPAAANPVLTPAPLNNVGSQFDISFEIGNSGTLDISGLNLTQKMGFTVSLGKCAPSFNNAVSTTGTNALSGSVLSYFDVTYDAPTHTFTGTQKSNTALGITPLGMHTLTIHLQVTTLSASASINDIGANLNVQPNPASSGSQTTSDDNASIFTHTVGGILPVVLSAFEAKASGCSVALQWSTGMEENFDHFELERSNDSKSFSRIATVSATGDNSTYNYTDAGPLDGTYAYRLRMADADGSAVYSNIRSVRVSCAIDGGLSVYPNPAHDAVRVSGLHEGNALRLMDMTGRVVLERTAEQSIESLDLSGLPAALYTIQVANKGAVIASVKLNKQ